MSIKFGNWSFTDPVPLNRCFFPGIGGVYCLSVWNWVWGPAPQEPVYFGKAVRFDERGLNWSHDAVRRWHFTLGRSAQLYVSFLLESSTIKRSLVEAALIAQYQPVLNIQQPRPVGIIDTVRAMRRDQPDMGESFDPWHGLFSPQK
jgi:hypothetical protein